MSSTWAVVPVKCFARGKSRLDKVFPGEAREELARSLCEHVLATLAECAEIEGILVATDCSLVARFAESRGALVVRDDAPAESAGSAQSPFAPAGDGNTAGGLAQVVDRALGVLALRGVGAAVVLMADLPLLAADDVRGLVDALDRTPIVVAPDRAGQGTNALALSPPDRIPTCFGSEISFSRHLARAERAGIPLSIHQAAGIAFDLDSPADFELVLSSPGVDVAVDYADRGARFSWNRKRPSRVRAA